MSYQVKTEKLISKPAADVFRALSEGRLFMNCGSDSQSMQIDFRVGGKYKIDFSQKTLSNFGEFLEIVPDKKIVFSWCQTFGPNQTPDTKVSIELFADGPKTRLVLTHTGFHDKATCDNHEKGWTSGMHDLAAEMENGKLRFLRSYKVSAAKLFETLNTPSKLSAYMGELSQGRGESLETIPNQKIVLAWRSGSKESKVTMTVTSKGDAGSTLELVHEGLLTAADQRAYRRGWENVTNKLSEVLS